MLEVLSQRELTCISMLFDINKYPDEPLQRFLCVTRWLLSCLQREEMEKKPFNSVIGEQHLCWIEHSDDNWSEYISEQVSHHPPVSAFFLRNIKENIRLHSNLEISIHFGGNYATIKSLGNVVLETAFETYKMNKISPDMNILNVVWGTKYFMWDGQVQIECEATGYKVELSMSEEDTMTNRIVGTISKGDEIVYHLNGVAGVKTHMWTPGDEENQIELYNVETFKQPDLKYPAEHQQVAFDSLKLWKPVSDPIVADDMWTADLAKKKIEQDQRVREKKRIAEGIEYEGVYFTKKDQEDGSAVWVYNEKETLSPEFLKKLEEKVAEEKREEEILLAEAARLAELQRQEAGEGEEGAEGQNQEGGEGCIIG